MRLVVAAPVAMLLLGCGFSAHQPASGIDGNEADVRTPLGVSGGHEVAMCSRFGHGRLVRGLGPAGYMGVSLNDKTTARFDAVDALMTGPIRPALAGIHSVWGTGVGLQCREDVPVIGGEVNLSSWRDVDQAIAGVASVLDAEHLGETVSIQVDGVPVAELN